MRTPSQPWVPASASSLTEPSDHAPRRSGWRYLGISGPPAPLVTRPAVRPFFGSLQYIRSSSRVPRPQSEVQPPPWGQTRVYPAQTARPPQGDRAAGRTERLDPNRLRRVGYIMPPIPPMPPMSGIPAPPPSPSGISTTTASVVRRRPAIDEAFWSADRTTFVGSMTPAFTISS